MANIANVRRFTAASSEWLRFTSTDYVGGTFDQESRIAILRSVTSPGESAYMDVMALSGGTGGRTAFLLNNGAGVTPGLARYIDGGDGFELGNYYQAGDGWVVLGWTKSAGNNVTVRTHRYLYDTTTWSHGDAGTGAVDAGTAASGTPNLYMGTWDSTIEFLDAEVAVFGWWHGTELSESQVETLHAGIAAWEALSPTGLWLLNQSTVNETVLDRIGSGDQVARNGTSVVTPTGLTFDVGGATPRFNFANFPKPKMRLANR